MLPEGATGCSADGRRDLRAPDSWVSLPRQTLHHTASERVIAGLSSCRSTLNLCPPSLDDSPRPRAARPPTLTYAIRPASTSSFEALARTTSRTSTSIFREIG